MPYEATTVELCETTWDEIAPVAGVTLNTDAADYKEGTKSTTIAPDGTVADGTLMATEDISALTPDLSSCHRLRFWIKSSVDTAAGDLQILLDAHANCASPEETLDVPALTAATWAYVTVSLADPASDGAIISIGLKYTLNAQACTIKLDAIYGDAMTPEFQKRELARIGSEAETTLTELLSRVTEFQVDSGTATGGSQTTCIDTKKSWETNMWALAPGAHRCIIEIYSVADDIYYLRTISSNTDTTITFAALPAGKAVAAGDPYMIRMAERKVTTVTEAQNGSAPAGVNVTTGSTTVLAANTSRLAAVICNDSDAVMWLAIGQTAVAHQGIRLIPNGVLILSQNGDLFSTELVSAIHAASGNKVASVQELT